MRGTPRSLPASVPRARLCSDPLVYGAIPSWDSKRREGSGDLLIHFVSPVLVYTAGAQQMLINKCVKRDVGPNRESIIGLPQRSRKLSELKLGGPWKGLDYNNWALTIFPALDVDYLNESSWRHRRNKIRQGKNGPRSYSQEMAEPPFTPAVSDSRAQTLHRYSRWPLTDFFVASDKPHLK